jgi:endonuclease G
MTISCHCSNHDFDEFEGEYYYSNNELTHQKEDKSELIKECGLPDKEIAISDTSTISLKEKPELPGLPKMNKKGQAILLKRKGYTVLYNISCLNPIWVSWHLTAEHADGECVRDNNYYEDEEVPLTRASNDDYKGSGWTRGHMCPAGDNKWDEVAMRESNLLTNICPQHASLNSGLWNKIEQDCRRWAKKYGDVYIVCGPVLLNKEHETIGENKVVVPEAFFKVILCLNPMPKAIGYIIRNNEGNKKKDQYVNTVDEVERITGIDFFPALPDDIEEVVEAKADIKDW